jgi:hypothetical protein
MATDRTKWAKSVAPPLSEGIGGKVMDIVHRLFVVGLFGSTVYIGCFIYSASMELRETKKQARLEFEAAEAAAATTEASSE